jgi:cytochrome P450
MTTVNEVPASLPGKLKEWPGPQGHWLLGCMRPLQNDPLTFHRENGQKYGDYVRIRILPGINMYSLSDPDGIEHVLYRNLKNYRKPDLFNTQVSLLAGNGILVSEGDFWLRQRRLSQPAFLKNRVPDFGPVIGNAVDRFISEWGQRDGSTAIDVVPEMMRLAMRIASMSLFSTDISGNADAIGHAFRVTFSHVSDKMNGRPTFPLWVPTRHNREFNQSKALLDKVVLELVESRRQSSTPQRDVLQMLLAAQDEESGTGMTDQQLRDEVLTLLTAGHETIGAALSWTWHLLSLNPEIQSDLAREVSGVLNGRTPTPADLPKMPLATAVFEESMRLYPPAWGMPREAIEPDVINGYPVPAKAIVNLSQWVTHRHPAFWKEPDRFDPSRFLPGAAHDRPRMAYFPFGGGPRICIGNHFALQEGPLVIAALIQKFDFAPVPGHKIVPDATFTLRPKTGVPLFVRNRSA